MAQLAASIVSHDEEFKRQAAALLRGCGVPVGIVTALLGAPFFLWLLRRSRGKVAA